MDGTKLALGAAVALALVGALRKTGSKSQQADDKVDAWLQANRLYHGTSLPRWERMKAGGPTTEPLYLAADRDHTLMYVQFATENDTDEFDLDDVDGVIITFDLNAMKRLGKLMPDWHDLWEAYHRGETELPPSEMTWLDSLAWGGTVSYEGPLSEAIIEVEIV